MTLELNLFIGGPHHSAHDEMVKMARTDRDIGPVFQDVRAFDDNKVKAASVGTSSWRNYLRTCEVAVFLFPATASGSRDPRTQKFYTELEIEQAYLAGNLIYFLFDRSSSHDTDLAKAARATFQHDVAYHPIQPSGRSGNVSDAAVLRATKNSLISAAHHWRELTDFVSKQIQVIQGLISQAGGTVDVTTARAKAYSGRPHEQLIQTFLAECWNFRRQCPRSGELPRFLFTAYLLITRPCFPSDDIRQITQGTSSDLWTLLRKTLTGRFPATLQRVPPAAKDLFSSLQDWRQRALITLLREISVGFRYTFHLIDDWKFAQRAIQLFLTLPATLDPQKDILFNLAISAVTSAAYAQRLGELTTSDPTNSLLNVLRERYDRDRNPGSAKTLGDFKATSGNLHKARNLLSESVSIYSGARAKQVATLHSKICLACCMDGKDRRDEFDSIEKMIPDWKSMAHPIYIAMAEAANSDLQKPWNDILSDVSGMVGQAAFGP